MDTRRSRSAAARASSGASIGVEPCDRVAAIQRSRLLAAALTEIDERGYAYATVAHITGRSRVSRRTFYELFANREECLVAVLEQAVAAIERELAEADLGGLGWRERVRSGLAVILSFFDSELALARVCVVQALGAGSRALEYREAVLARLIAAVDEGRDESSQSAQCTPLTAEGVVGAALAILHARLLRRDPEPLGDLLGELVAMVLLPYQGKAAARREQMRTTSVQGQDAALASRPPGRVARDPLMDVPMRLTYRTARVLEGVAEHPGASNRQLGDYAGIHDQGQVSKLLARLQRLGLLENRGDHARSKGEPNAWTLTSKGHQVAQSIRTHTTHRRAA